MRRNLAREPLGRLGGQGRGRRVVIVGDDCLTRVDPGGPDSGGLKRPCDNPAAEELARSGDAITRAGGGFAKADDAAEFCERFKGEPFNPNDRGRGANWARWNRR